MLQQLLSVEVRDQEGNVVALPQLAPSSLPTILPFLSETLDTCKPPKRNRGPPGMCTHLDRLPPQNKEVLRPLLKEPREFMHKDILDLVRLLDPYADAHTIHAGLNQHPLVLVPRDRQRR